MAREEDRICKEYFDQNDRFSDLVNFTLYNGKEVTKPSDFISLDPVISEVFSSETSYEVIIDNLKELSLKEDDRNIYAMIGLESQGYHDKSMVLRAMKVKALLYSYQFRKGEKPLKPVIIIVVNLTGKRWKNPVKLKDMFEKKYLDMFDPLIDEVSYLLVDIKDDSVIPKGLLKTDLELILNCLKYSRDKEKFEEYIQNEEGFKDLDDITFKLINISSVLDVEIKKEGGKIKMWPAVKQMKEESYEAGYKAGYKAGQIYVSYIAVKLNNLSVEDAAKEFDLTVEEYLAEVEKVSDYLKNR